MITIGGHFGGGHFGTEVVMTAERLRQMEHLYHAVLERPQERAALLAQADPELRSEVESLLAQDSQPGMLDLPPLGVTVAKEVTQTAGLPATEQQAPMIGQYIGQYRIVAKLGEGGMGVVYQAEQSHPRRLVALKMIRGSGSAQERAVRMFQREADALGRLRHSGIAGVHESGQTPDGQHYFTMELVPGVPLNGYLKARQEQDAKTGELKLRLALFDKICSAVSYAHQRGVIHRDLKPSNILVAAGGTENDIPEVKILDFGLARINEDPGTTTIAPGLHGTLAYMSPEQSRGVSGEVDLRTDVYSLGVILYEMLAGYRPYEIEGKDLLEAVRVIRQEPPQPLHTLWSGSKLDADLSSIVLKALEKEPARRYQSVAAMAEDIQRYGAGQAVLAQPPSTFYQARKLVSRHKLGFSFAGTLVLMLALFAVVMAVQARRIAGERNRANQEAKAAQQVSDFLVGLFEVSNPGEARGNNITAREILENGAAKIERELKDQPVVQARMQYTIGKVFIQLGLAVKAVPLLESARIKQARLPENDPALPDTLDRLATAYQELGQYDKAEPLFRRSLDLEKKSHGPESLDVASAMNNLGMLRTLRGDYKEGEQLFQGSLAIKRKAGGRDAVLGTVDVLTNLAYIADAFGRSAETIDYLKQSLSIKEQFFPPDHPEIAQGLANLGVALWRDKRNAEAAPNLERALSIYQKVYGPEHTETGRCMANLANIYVDAGDYGKAEPLIVQSLAIREKKLGPNHTDVAHSLNRFAVLRQKQHRYSEAISLFQRSVAIYDKVSGPDSVDAAGARTNFANMYREAGRFAEAEPLFRAAVTGLEKSIGPTSPRLVLVLESYARMLRDAGRGNEAEQLETRAKDIRSRTLVSKGR